MEIHRNKLESLRKKALVACTSPVLSQAHFDACMSILYELEGLLEQTSD